MKSTTPAYAVISGSTPSYARGSMGRSEYVHINGYIYGDRFFNIPLGYSQYFMISGQAGGTDTTTGFYAKRCGLAPTSNPVEYTEMLNPIRILKKMTNNRERLTISYEQASKTFAHFILESLLALKVKKVYIQTEINGHCDQDRLESYQLPRELDACLRQLITLENNALMVI